MARVMIALILLIIIICIAAVILYMNRNAAYETVIKRLLAERGYEIELTVESATTEQAVAKNITVAQNGTPIGSLKSLTTTYDWDEVFDGKLESLTLNAPTLSVEIDASGKIISDWMPKPAGGAPLTLPSEGITVNGADIEVISPYGILNANGNAAVKSLTDITADIRFESEQLSTRGYGAKASGKLDAIAKNGQVTLKTGSAISLTDITGPSGPIADADLALTGVAGLPGDTGRFSYTGAAKIDARDFTGPFFDATRSVLNLDGDLAYNVKSKTVLPSQFSLTADLDDLALRDADMRRDLAGRITLEKTLAATPVAGGFIGDITGSVESLLTRANWTAGVSVDYRETGYSVNVDTAVRAKNDDASIVLTPLGDGAEFAWIKDSKALTLKSDIVLTAPRSLKLDNFSIRGTADNGYLWSAVSGVSGQVKTQQTWREAGTRLAPFDVNIGYTGGAQSSVKITGPVDYDGPLLGNEFEGLQTQGALTYAQKRGGFDLYFDTDAPIKAARVETPFGYAARDLAMSITPGAPLLKRRGDTDTLSLRITDPSAYIDKISGKDRYTLRAGAADVTGTLGPGGDTYSVNAADIDVQSDTTPGPDSRLYAKTIDVGLRRSDKSPIEYTISSPAVRAKAGTVTLKDVPIDVSGTPDATEFYYSGGTVSLAGTNLPPLPVSGKGQLAGGALKGSAVTALDRAPQFPIYVNYVYENGEGSAQLEIPKFIFSPGGVQPQSLAPALRGKIAAVEGTASAKATIGFKPGQPLTSKGTVSVMDMNAGTLVGPLTGLTADLQFDSLYPLRSTGQQTVTMTGFDPGIPLGAGTVTFTVVKNGFDLIDARWPMGEGEISVKPTFWSTAGAVNNVTVDVRNISLGDLIERIGNADLSATGQINGELPVVIDGVNLNIDGGKLAIKDGGVISVKTKQLDRAGEMNDTAKIAVDALRNFEYDELSLELNGPLDGEMKLGAVFIGSNPDVLGGADFLFRTNIEGELANIARNLASATQMQNIKDSIAQKVDERKAGGGAP